MTSAVTKQFRRQRDERENDDDVELSLRRVGRPARSSPSQLADAKPRCGSKKKLLDFVVDRPRITVKLYYHGWPVNFNEGAQYRRARRNATVRPLTCVQPINAP